MAATAKQSRSAHVRWMIQRDTDEVLTIENACFEAPWTRQQLIEAMRQRHVTGMVAERDCRIDGFMVYELHKTKLHVLNFAVHPTYQREGVGRAMAHTLLAKLSAQRRSQILLEIRETNTQAQLFFRAMGFRAVKVIRDFYENTTEDAYLFEYRVSP